MKTTLSHHSRGARRTVAVLAGLGMLGLAASAGAAVRGHEEIRNDLSQCRADRGPALMVTVDGIKSSSGTIRVQSYRATPDDWLQAGRWISRIETPARAGSMTFCVPLPATGTFGIAVRHDVDGNGKTDIGTDGGAMSNNPSINIFNLGKPSYSKVGVQVGNEVKSIRIQMRYM
ncbi:uncharacterized protein (DUF2141 family) [Novosphingobium sp. PhB165]|uniref:DUF2141 domain-containing protein n=1 Tax=Novosphingobium sp. PhB165 TaxID=2485105 RepID=UPI0010506368|nr:DUF2141 domain-containing protein [Novosphingobium sp. PhB165]TCM16910.1 uncharacterized protein (DUF2141 family) [Novosphingobium sp. PhB165]